MTHKHWGSRWKGTGRGLWEVVSVSLAETSVPHWGCKISGQQGQAIRKNVGKTGFTQVLTTSV